MARPTRHNSWRDYVPPPNARLTPTGRSLHTPTPAAPPPGVNKFHAEKTIARDGTKLDSGHEARLYQDLLYRERAGEISELRRQVPFPLDVNGQRITVVRVDFVYRETATGELVYKKVLPMKPKTEYWNWAGVSASPTQAGKYIYLMDNQGLTIVLQPGRVYKEVAQNMLEESRDGKSQEQNVSTPVFEGSRMYYRTPGYLYCIGG